MKLTVIIPVYNNLNLILSCLENNYQYIKNQQIIIIDDASGEKISSAIKKKYPSIRIICNSINLGFPASVNKGIRASKTDYVMLLNSDVKLIDSTYNKTRYLFAKNKNLFAVTFAQIEQNQQLVGSNKYFFKKGFFYHQKSPTANKKINGWAEGGSSIFSKKILSKLSGFDEIYSPFYWEDIDLSYRAYKSGYAVIYDPSIRVIHHHESTIAKYFSHNYVKKIAYRNQFIFIWKNITDINLIINHLIYLPYQMIKMLAKQDINYFRGFFEAVLLLPAILRKRQSQKLFYRKADIEVLNQF